MVGTRADDSDGSVAFHVYRARSRDERVRADGSPKADDRARADGRHPADERAQVEAVSSLLAVAVVVAAVSLHAGVLADAVPESDRDVADPTLRRVHDRLAGAGVVRPPRLANASLPGPDGFRLNVSVTVDGRRWTRGPVPPVHAGSAGRSTAVRLAPAHVRPGRLRVVVWR